MKKINVALIGCGAISIIHAQGIANNPATELVYVVDKVTAKAEKMAQVYHCKMETNYQNLLDNPAIDMVIICTPHYLHKEMSIAFLQHGKHVLCEKPMALTVKDGEEILAIAASVEVEYAVCFQNRFNDASVKLKELLEVNAQEFGQLKGAKLTLSWHRTKAYYADSDWRGDLAKEGGGVLMNQAIHTIDLITWLVGVPESVKGQISRNLFDSQITVEDTAMALALYEHGQPLTIYATNTFSRDLPPEIYLEFEHGEVSLVGSDWLKVNKELLVAPSKAEAEKTAPSLGKTYWGNSHQRLIAEFVYRILQKPTIKTNYLPKENGLDALKIIEGIYLSSKANQRITLKNNNLGDFNEFKK
ncbi:Gfo/Idh/MocA family protein [Carnobacterium gallinarum]|uniref:Gfo/Idh/MocA family protein n=1 Tax=Carnobacterium gallinarum TaxID=2749 RepID=UPI00068ED303|nr:Gfo/Idh/MocA family oxidoreductase [Carnobacterium gallinarum]